MLMHAVRMCSAAVCVRPAWLALPTHARDNTDKNKQDMQNDEKASSMPITLQI